MKIAILIPDRGDRPQLMAQCLAMMQRQTRRPDVVMVVSDAPLSDKKDITWRYRTGYDRLRGLKLDAIFCIENDDYYSPFYIEKMLEQWVAHGRPALFGMNFTIYYHLKLRAWFIMEHFTRSCMMNTIMKPDMEIDWGKDHDPYADLQVWINNKHLGEKVTWRGPGWPYMDNSRIAVSVLRNKLLSIAMKHGEGLCGGNNHLNRLDRYIVPDREMDFLRLHVDEEMMGWYEGWLIYGGEVNSVIR